MPNKYYNKQVKKKDQKDSSDDWQFKVAQQVIKEWDDGKTFTTSLNDMYEDLYLMIRGKRPKKNYDWQSDITLRKAFQILWTMITYVSQKIYGAYPVIGVSGFDKKGCWQRETLLETWMEESKYFLTIVQGLMRLGLNGVMIGKKAWKQTMFTVTRPDGQSKQFPKEDRPVTTILNNKDVVVDWLLKPGQSITDGRFVIHRSVVDLSTLYGSKAKYINLEDIESGASGKTTEAADHGRLKQEDNQESPPEHDTYSEVELFERQGLWPVKIDKKGNITPLFDREEIYSEGTQWRQMICTIADHQKPVLVRWEENPYGEMTYFDAQLYIDAERWQSQGVLEPAKDIFIAQDDNVNAMFDEIWKNLFPPTIVNKFAIQDWDSIKWAPSQLWLASGNPNDNFMVTRGTEITRDAWSKHQLLEGEIQTITPVTHGIQGAGTEKTATLGVLNTNFSANKLDFITKMVEVTWLIPDAKMTLRFAQKFAHPLTILKIIGEPLKFDQYLDEYSFRPCASSVKLPEQREKEIAEDIQLLQTLAPFLGQNPGAAAVINELLQNIMRNRNRPNMAMKLDPNYFEPQTPAGQMQRMVGGGIEQGSPSNEQGLPMTGKERAVRERTFTPRGMMQ